MIKGLDLNVHLLHQLDIERVEQYINRTRTSKRFPKITKNN